MLATAEWVHWYGHHPATLRHRDANPRRARSHLGTRHPTPGTITTSNHRHQINQPPQNPGLDNLASTLGTDLSHETISKITDQISQEVLAWQHRPLDGLYPVIYLDAIMIKVRDGAHVTNKAAHIAVGVDMDGIKHVLGIWVQASEGARFWAQVCAELANRGIKDVLIVCCDGLTGLPEAIEATWPQATVQTCVVHLIRAATRFVSYSDRKAVAAALRPIYQAPSEEAAWEALETFEASELGQRYPAAVRTFTDSWERFTPFLAFPPMVRRVISPPLRGRYPLHQHDRGCELPAAQGHQEPGSLPLRRGSGQAAESWLSATSRTREPDNAKRSSRKDDPARARPPAD